MKSKMLMLSTMALVLTLFIGQNAYADKVHEGHVVKAGDGKLTVHSKGSDKPHSHEVPKTAVITLDGKPAKLDDLKEGFHVKVTTDDKQVITKIDAHSKSK